ncbi:MAG: two-component system, sensor histidine kinase and response regulator [Nocardioidaceae bacterium]|nr:two-component system, sensor histidine kinase and response regulator [Nocardioidaceae bacterium]
MYATLLCAQSGAMSTDRALHRLARRLLSPLAPLGGRTDDVGAAEGASVPALKAAHAQAERERDSYAVMLRSIIQNSPTAISVKDLQGRYLLVNEPFERIFGTRDPDLLGLPDQDATAEPVSVSGAEDVRAQVGPYQVEECIDAADGPHMYESVRFPMYDAAGSLYATGGISLDVTEERRASARVAEALDAALSASRAKSTFLATMSHELRTPMNAVLGMADLLRDTDLDTEQAEFVETVSSSGNALLAVIDHVLDFSVIEAGEVQLEPVPFDLVSEMEDCLEPVAAAAGAKGLDLVCFLDGIHHQSVVGDVGRLRQILANLLANAVKFTDVGEVLLSAGTESKPPHGVRLTVNVTDSGTGIAPDRLDRLFKPFSQVDASATRAHEGTGLGLAITQRLAEAMGGGVTVTSTPGEGSSFAVNVQLVEGPEVLTDTSSPPTRSALDGRSVLVVDDNATSLHIVDLQLTNLGMRCTSALSPESALSLVAEGLVYDVGVIDMSMPGMTAMELAHALGRVPKVGAAPLVLLQGVGAEPASTEPPFVATLTKPVRASVLAETLAAVIAEDSEESEEVPRVTAPPIIDAVLPLRVLLAEDNVVNQRVAQIMLSKLGHRVETVANGQAAVDAVVQGDFDVVLMDIQMPVMDGVEAARRIRAALPGGKQPRIIAMTASVLLEDRRAAKAAGMERYLSKPVRVRELKALLEWTSANRRSSDSGLEDGSTKGTEVPPDDVVTPRSVPLPSAVDDAVFEELVAELGDPDGEFLTELVSSYLEEGTAQSAELIRTAAEGDAIAFAATAHTWRSTSALIGATTLASLLLEAEASARESSAALPAQAEAIAADYRLVSAWLVQRLQAV